MSETVFVALISIVSTGALLGLYNAFFKNRRSDVLIMIDGYRGQLADAQRHIAQLEARFDVLEKELDAEKDRRFLAEESHSAAQQTIALLEGHQAITDARHAEVLADRDERIAELESKTKHLQNQLNSAIQNGGRLRRKTPTS